MTADAAGSSPPAAGACAVYGTVPQGLAEVAQHSVQCSPRIPGSASLEDFTPASLSGFVMLAPPNTDERRHEVALALRSLAGDAPLTVLAANNRGGNRLAGELEGFGCRVTESHKHHHRIVHARRPASPIGLDAAIAGGAPRLVDGLGLWSQPGIFSWDRIDAGTRLLIAHLPVLTGQGADLGCGFGALARHVRQAAPPVRMVLIDIDRRALAMARRNVPGDGVTTLWADARAAAGLPGGLDFVVCNPPFHDGGTEDRALGQAFVERAAAMLRPGGQLWLTANRHLPYEATLAQHFGGVAAIAQAAGYKIYAATRAARAAKSGSRR